MKWYVPSWNGDIRIEAAEDDPNKTNVVVIDPTPHELSLLDTIIGVLRDNGWVGKRGLFRRKQPLWKSKGGPSRQVTLIDAPVTEVAPIIVREYKPGQDVITAVVFQNGEMRVATGTGDDFEAITKTAKEKGAKKAASARRPTPSCPQCHGGPIDAATEVLLEFLTPAQHKQYAKAKAIVVSGSHTGHRYLLVHRHTPLAQKIGRMCFDLDDGAVMHFHDTTVPPAEEVLGAKLALEHREPWLRNRGTIEPGVSTDYFQNPFPEDQGGVPDADFTRAIGRAATQLLGLSPSTDDKPAEDTFRFNIRFS